MADRRDKHGRFFLKLWLTDSWNSGSEALASHRLLRTKIFGFDIFVETSWKKDFSWKIKFFSQHWIFSNLIFPKLTASVIVDSAFNTSTKTSAFKQWLSIQSSRFCETSTPGESTNTTSSRSKLHLSRGQKIRTSELSHNFSWHKALASCFTDWKMRYKLWNWVSGHQLMNQLTVTLSFSSDPSFTKYASWPSTPSTWQKQFVVCPIPLGRILSLSIALITELLPFDVRPKNATFMWSLASTSRMLLIFSTKLRKVSVSALSTMSSWLSPAKATNDKRLDESQFYGPYSLNSPSMKFVVSTT